MSAADEGSSGGRSGDSAAQGRQRQIRETILNAAHACLVEVGFEHITTRRIAEAAGVNIATLHYYFGSKEALLTEAVKAGILASQRSLLGAIDAAPDAPHALQAGFTKVWELVREQPGRLRFDLVVRGFRNAEARETALGIWNVLENVTCVILERHVKEGGTLAGDLTPELLATHLVSVMDGVILRFALSRDESCARMSLSLILADTLRVMGIEDGRIANEFNRF